ncbi:hypothetical protein V8E36_007632 [Tilletia maclaganii]
MKLYRAHDGLSLSLPAPPAATSTLDDLLDCLSLATGIASDNIICMTADGAQLHPDNYRTLLTLDPADSTPASAAAGDTSHAHDLEFFIYNREYLYAEPISLAQQLALPTHLEQPLTHIEELPEPGTPEYAASVLPWAQHALSLIRTHASRTQLAHAALSNMHRASAIALANLLQYTRTIAAGADALNGSVGIELARMKDLLDGYERDLRILGMVPIDPRLLNPSSRESTTGAPSNPGGGSGKQVQPSSASPASTPSSQGHGMSLNTSNTPTKRLGDYVSRQRMSAVASACAKVHAELAGRFANLHNHMHALQTDVNALEGEVHSVDLGPAMEGAEAAREARQRAEEIVERGLVPWLSGALAPSEEDYHLALAEGRLPPFPIGPSPAQAPSNLNGSSNADGVATPEVLMDHDQDRLHNQLEETLTELVLLDEVTRASVLRLSQDRNDMQARIITFLQDISAVQSDLGEVAEAMEMFEKEEMPPGAAVRASIKAQQMAFANAQAQAAQLKGQTQQQQQQARVSQANANAAAAAGTGDTPAATHAEQSTAFTVMSFAGTATGTITGLAGLSTGAFVIDGFRPTMTAIVSAAASAGNGLGVPQPGSSSSTNTTAAGGQQTQVRTDGFRHLARLHHMLLAYGATLIELVRRATFSRLFLKSAQSVAELMALVSEREVERRKEWRKAGVGAILPWDVRALSLVPMSGSSAGGGGGALGASSAFGDEGTPMLEISTKGMMLSLGSTSGGGGGAGGTDPLAAALASAAELGREDVDRLFALLDEIERGLDQEAESARESQQALAFRRRSGALRQQSSSGGGGSFALPQGQRSPATPPQPASALQSPLGGQMIPLLSQQQQPANPVPEVRAALQLLVEEIDDMEPEFKDLVNVTLLERKARSRRRRASRRAAGNGLYGANAAGDDDQTSDPDDDESDEDNEAESDSVVNGAGGGARPGPRATRRTMRKQLKELTSRLQEAESATASAHVSLETIQTENTRLRSNLAHLSEEHHAAYAAIRLELENVRSESRSNAEAYDRARHARDDALAQTEGLRNDVDTERARRLNLEEEVTNVRRDLKEARRDEADAKREALELEERLAELELQTHELQHELENAVSAREDVSNRMEGLLKEGSSVERELASAQTRIEALNREASAARTELREAREALAEEENARDKLIRNVRAEADGDRAILEESVRSKEHELRLARESLKMAELARKAAEGREAAERGVSDGLRGQLEAADVAHESMLRDLEESREESVRLEAQVREAVDERDELLRLARPLLSKAHALRKMIRAIPTPTSSSSSSSKGSPAADRDGGRGATRPAAHERSESTASVTSEGGATASAGPQQSTSSAAALKADAVLKAAIEAFEKEGEGTASTATTLAALRALEPRLFHDEARAKLDALMTLLRKWQRAYKATQEKIARMQAAARDRIAYRNFQVGDLVLFLPTRNTSARTFAAFNRGFPHYFLRAEGGFGEQIRSKDYLLDRITAVSEHVAGVPSVTVGSAGGDGLADAANPYQLAPGVRYHILDVEGASAGGGADGSRGVSTSVPQTPSRIGSIGPRSVSHGAPVSASRRSSVAASPSSVVSETSSPLPPPPSSSAGLQSVTAAGGAHPPPPSNPPSGLTLSRSTSRLLERAAVSASVAMTESDHTAAGGTGTGGSTATITPHHSVGGGAGSGAATATGPSPSELGSTTASIPVPAFGTRARGAGLKRRVPGDAGNGGDVSGESAGTGTGMSPASMATSLGSTAIAPAVPLPISKPRNANGTSSSIEGHHQSHFHLSNRDRSGPGGAGGYPSHGPTPTAAELQRGLKDTATSRTIAEALAAEGLQSIGNPFSASPSGVGSLVEHHRTSSFGGRTSLSAGATPNPGLPGGGLRNGKTLSSASTSASGSRRAGASSSSSSGGVSNLGRAARREGAFRRAGGGGSSGVATPQRAGFFPSRGAFAGLSGTNEAGRSPAGAVESLATAHGESGQRRWGSPSPSLGGVGVGSPRSSEGGVGGPSWLVTGEVGGSAAHSRAPSSIMASPSPSGKMQRQLSSEGSGSGFSAISSNPRVGAPGILGLTGARGSNLSSEQQAGSSDVAFPRSRSHTSSVGGGSSSGPAAGSGGTLGRTAGAASRKESFGSGFLSSLTFGRASARKQSLQGGSGSRGSDPFLGSSAATDAGPRRSTLEMILGWPTGGSGASEGGGAGSAKGKRAVRGSFSEGAGGVLLGGTLEEDGGGGGGLEVGSPGSEAGSATAAEMLRRLARAA